MAKRAGLDEVGRRLDAGETVRAIAAELGVTERTIRNRLHAAGLPLARERPRADRRRMLSDPVWLRGQYVDDARSPWAIAKGLGLSAAAVHNALDEFGIERPPKHPELTEGALKAAFANGVSVKSIAKAAGVDRTAVRREMRRYGIENPNPSPRRPAELDDADWLRARYVDGGHSITSVAREASASVGAVRRALVRQGIVRTEPWGTADIDAGWLRERCEVDRAPIEVIAAEAGVSWNTIRRAAHRLGLERASVVSARRPHPHAGRPGGIDPGWLRERYVDDRLSLAKIARQAGVGESTVHHAVHRHGLERPPLATPRRPHPHAHRPGGIDPEWLRRRYLDDGLPMGCRWSRSPRRQEWAPRRCIGRWCFTASRGGPAA